MIHIKQSAGIGTLFLSLFLGIGCSSTKVEDTTHTSTNTIKAKVVTISLQPMPLKETVIGTVISKDQANVSSRVMGSILEIYVKEGDVVKAGQRIVRLDSKDLQPSVDKANAGIQEITSSQSELDKNKTDLIASQNAARANFDYASTTHQRYQNLYNRQAISKEMYEETIRQYKLAQANLDSVSAKLNGLEDKRNQLIAKKKQANADVELSKTYLGYANIQSPISGIIVKKVLEKGSMASPGQTIMVIESSDYQFQTALKESLNPIVKLGLKVQVQLAGLTQILDGTVSEILPASDPISRTFTIKINLPKLNELRSGIYGKVFIPMGEENKLTAPKSSLIERGSLQGVYTVDSTQTSRFRLVKTGSSFGDNIEITSGIQPGDQVIVSGVDAIQDGMRVETIQ